MAVEAAIAPAAACLVILSVGVLDVVDCVLILLTFFVERGNDESLNMCAIVIEVLVRDLAHFRDLVLATARENS